MKTSKTQPIVGQILGPVIRQILGPVLGPILGGDLRPLRHGGGVRRLFQAQKQVHRRLGAKLVDHLRTKRRVRDTPRVDVGDRYEVGLGWVLSVRPHDVARDQDLCSHVLFPASTTAQAVLRR